MSKNNPGASIVASLIPPGSVGVEIGVWEGASSLEFAERARYLYLVDPWPGRDDQYRRVKELFAGRNVTVMRHTSKEFLESLHTYNLVCSNTKNEDKKVLFDWFYIDGLHDYESVKADLIGASKLLKPTGIIYGDDYGKKDGVQQAVDEFAPHRRLLGLSQYAIP